MQILVKFAKIVTSEPLICQSWQKSPHGKIKWKSWFIFLNKKVITVNYFILATLSYQSVMLYSAIFHLNWTLASSLRPYLLPCWSSNLNSNSNFQSQIHIVSFYKNSDFFGFTFYFCFCKFGIFLKYSYLWKISCKLICHPMCLIYD